MWQSMWHVVCYCNYVTRDLHLVDIWYFFYALILKITLKIINVNLQKRAASHVCIYSERIYPRVQIMDGLQSAAVYELILMRVHHVRYLRLVLWPGATLPCHHSEASCSPSHSYLLVLQKRSIRRSVITEKAPTRAFSWLKAATTAFTFKLRHY